MTLDALLLAAKVEPLARAGNDEISFLGQDSRSLEPGALFVCNPGTTTDSHAYLSDAAARGAVAAIVHSRAGYEQAASLNLAAVLLPENRIEFNDAICMLCNAFFGFPTREMKVVGVTGTNGKTTTAWLIRDMLQSVYRKVAYLGTLGIQLPGEERELGNTTPFPVELWTLLAEARDKGVEAIAMEVSSHALAEHRCEYVEFDAGVFTNLTQDHLDFHGSMEEYQAAKLRLFTDLAKQTTKRFTAVLNVDDAVGKAWATQLLDVPVVRFGLTSDWGMNSQVPPTHDILGRALEVKVDEVQMVFESHSEADAGFYAKLGGSYNLENLAAAVSAVVALGASLTDAVEYAKTVRPVPGRFEAVPNDRSIGILVDYAHTPDALEKLLDAVRPLANGRVITVFGCGGDRDRTKRPKMARAASERSDVTVVTSDNPRTEDPQSILDEVLTGIVAGRESVDIIDRREAVAHAIRIARPGDVVVIAGKGHENYQIIGRTKYPMDDRELAREALVPQ